MPKHVAGALRISEASGELILTKELQVKFCETFTPQLELVLTVWRRTLNSTDFHSLNAVFIDHYTQPHSLFIDKGSLRSLE